MSKNYLFCRILWKNIIKFSNFFMLYEEKMLTEKATIKIEIEYGLKAPK